jgi:aryl-alcohol dehydrogenase-like predicted oxidoreductase
VFVKRAFHQSVAPISVLGFGALSAGEPGSRLGATRQTDRQSIAAIHRAVSYGVTWIDTAGVYGEGHSERVVGKAVGGVPPAERPMVFTKCGLRRGATRRETTIDVRPSTIRADCELSLRRLDMDQLDLLQLHWPPSEASGDALEDAWGALTGLRTDGKIRFIGASNFSVAQLERCEKICHVDALQVRVSLAHPEARDGALPWADAAGTAVLAYGTIAGGLLAERWTASRISAMHPNDHRRLSPDFASPLFDRHVRIRETLVPIAARHGVTTGAVAIAWALAQLGVTGAIVGARRPEQVDGWVAGAWVRLDAEETSALERVLAELGPSPVTIAGPYLTEGTTTESFPAQK